MARDAGKMDAKWKAILVLIMVVSVILFAGFKLSAPASRPSISGGPVSQNVVTWESERPTYIFDFEQKINSTFFDGGWINASVLAGLFNPDDQFFMLDLNLTSDLNEGFVQNVTVTIQSNSSSWVELDPANPDEMNSENLNVTSYSEGRGAIGSVEKAFVEFTSENNSHQVSISVWPMWWCAFSETEQMNVSFATSYFNGTNYKEVVQPFSLALLSDNEHTFDTAREVVANQTVTGFIGGESEADFFKVYLDLGETINVTVLRDYRLLAITFSLYTLTNENNPLMSSPICEGISLSPASISYSVNSTGWYYVEVEWVAGDGPYTMTLTAAPGGIS